MSKPSLVRTLSRHRKAVNALAFCPEGSILLSGGDDGLLVAWSLTTGEVLQEISCNFNGPVTSIVWVPLLDGELSFVFGCIDGSLHVYQRRGRNSSFEFSYLADAHDGGIEDIVFNVKTSRLASVGNGVAQVWNVGKEGCLTKVTPPLHTRLIARKAFFCDDGASVLICYLESHKIVCYTIEPWILKWSHKLRTRIGHASLNGQKLTVSNLCTGLDQYLIPTMEHLRHYPHGIIRNSPLLVATMRDGDWIVSGGDNGFARIFDSNSGQFLHRLEHGSAKDVVQVVATHQKGLIATGLSNEGPSTIQVWADSQSAKRESRSTNPAAVNMSQWQTMFLLVLCTILVNIANRYLSTILDKVSWRDFVSFVTAEIQHVWNVTSAVRDQ